MVVPVISTVPVVPVVTWLVLVRVLVLVHVQLPPIHHMAMKLV
jgi:hypothetical protein